MIDQLSKEEIKSDHSLDSFVDKSNNFHIYPNTQNVLNAYHNSQPISIIIDTSNLVYAVSLNDNLSCFCIGNFESEVMGHNYFNIEPPITKNNYMSEIDILTFGLLLPKLCSHEKCDEISESGIYTVSTKEFGLYHFKPNEDSSTIKVNDSKKNNSTTNPDNNDYNVVVNLALV